MFNSYKKIKSLSEVIIHTGIHARKLDTVSLFAQTDREIKKSIQVFLKRDEQADRSQNAFTQIGLWITPIMFLTDMTTLEQLSYHNITGEHIMALFILLLITKLIRSIINKIVSGNNPSILEFILLLLLLLHLILLRK